MKERQSIHRICPCHRFDIEGIQTWLEDMAKDGWVLEKGGYGLGTFTFQKSKPKRCRYRMEVQYTGNRSYDDKLSYLELIKESGWSLITEFQGFEIFCTEDPNARELSTDPFIQASTLTKLKHAQRNRFLYLVFYVTGLNIVRRWSWLYLFRNTATFGPLATGLMLCFLLYAFMLPLMDIFRIRQTEKILKSGILLNRRKEWKPHAAVYRFCEIFPVVLCVLVIVSWIGGLLTASNQQKLSSHISDPPFITVEDLAEDGYELSTPPLGGSNYYVTWSNSVSPVNYEWREYARFNTDTGSNNGFLVVEYHETVSEWFANGLFDDYYIYQTSRNDDWEDLQIPDFGLDEVRVIGDFGSYDVLIRHGNTVIYASYAQWNDGDVPDWQIWLEAMAKKLLSA